MEEQNNQSEQGQSIVIVAIAVIVLLLFVVIAVDVAYGYVHRRGDQNAADAAALGGARELAGVLNNNEGTVPGGYFADIVKMRMNDFAERNGIEDTGGAPGDTINQNVKGYWLDETGNRIMDPTTGNAIEINEGGFIHPDARGVEAIAYSVAPSFFGGIVGLDGLPIQAEAAVVFNGAVCTMNCIAPIATYTMTFQHAPHCYNIWDGSRQTRTIAPDNKCSNYPTYDCTKHNQCNFGPKCNVPSGQTVGTCSGNSNVLCQKDKDCSKGVCVGIENHCSNALLTVCSTHNQCNFGACVNNKCQQDPYPFCTSDADCVGTCGIVGDYFGSQCYYEDTGDPSGISCEYDENCPPGQYCEEKTGSSGSSSGLGWLNWSLQDGDTSCKDVGQGSDCSTTCLVYNLTPQSCLSGDIGVGSWVAGASGVKNASGVRDWLQWYIDTGEPMTVVVYDTFAGSGCNQDQNPNKLQYHVVGFAKFKVVGYMLAQGGGSAYGHDGAGCEDWGMEGNRITGEFLEWVDGTAGDCDPAGTIIAPRVVK